MIRRAIEWILDHGTLAEWIGDAVGVLSLFALLYVCLWAAVIFE